MTRTDFFGQDRYTVARIGARIFGMIASASLAVALTVRSILSRDTLLGDAEAIISLTSHGERLRRVHLVIEAIGRGKVRPREMVLWVDPNVDTTRLPTGLRRAQKRGLQIRNSPDSFGPHTKYFPETLEMSRRSELADLDLVTADDDILYPRDWLSTLMQADNSDGSVVVCHRAHRISMNGESIAPYRHWKRAEGTTASVLNFATGVMGVRYPAAFARSLAKNGPGFMELCPRADDVWLHATALREGLRVRQVREQAREYRVMLGSQQTSLVAHNAFDGGNDRQIEATYTVRDIELLLQAQRFEIGGVA